MTRANFQERKSWRNSDLIKGTLDSLWDLFDSDGGLRQKITFSLNFSI